MKRHNNYTDDILINDSYVWYEKDWQHELNPHTHKYYQLTYVEDGYQYFHIDQKVYFVPQNHIILIPSDTLHRTTSDSKLVTLKVILFKNPPQGIFYSSVRVFHAPAVLKEMIIYANKWNKHLIADDEQSAFLKAMIISLPHLYQENNFLEIPIPKDHRLIDVCEYVNRNYKYNSEIEELARIAKISERSLQRIFKAETGITLKKYLQIIRILKSIELIDENQYTLSEIAYKIGYKSLSAFTTSFKDIMKMSPRRKRNSSILTNKTL